MGCGCPLFSPFLSAGLGPYSLYGGSLPFLCGSLYLDPLTTLSIFTLPPPSRHDTTETWGVCPRCSEYTLATIERRLETSRFCHSEEFVDERREQFISISISVFYRWLPEFDGELRCR